MGFTKKNILSALTRKADCIVGSVHLVANTSVSTGFLECGGQAVSRSTYADLFSAIGTTYGNGNGTTTFNVSDLRGEFVRGYDNGRCVDSGRGIGTTQLDDFKSHTHTDSYIGYSSGSTVGKARTSTGTSAMSYGVGYTGGTETRPRNIAMMYIIKF